MGQAAPNSSNPRRRPPPPSGGGPGPSGRGGGDGGAYPIDLTIASDFDDARVVQKRILDHVEQSGFNSQSVFAIKLALEEALINAIKHGNKFHPDKTVRVLARVTSGVTEIIIEDQGAGFVRDAVPDPTLDENIEKCSGRGILLMESYMSEVEWSQGGRRVRMIKRNEPDVLPRP